MAGPKSEAWGSLSVEDSASADLREPDLPERAARALLEEGLGSGRSAGPVQVVDLFSGCGGLSAGFELVGRRFGGYRLTAAAELDSHANRTYAANLGLEPLEVDLAEAATNPAALAAFRERLQLSPELPLVVVGGPPCQGFSAHRKRVSHSRDPRNSLVRAFAVIAASLEPDLIVMENVPEVLAKRHWKHFAAFRSVLEEQGYGVIADVHNLAGFGVPQERFRTLAVAARGPVALPRPFLGPGEFRTVRDAIGQLPPVSPGKPLPEDPMHLSTRHRQSTIDVIRQVPRDGGNRPAGVGPACLDRVDGFRDVYCRLYWDRPANTITGYARNPASGRFTHPHQDRGLTIREAALLQGFPSDFTFEGPFDDKFSQIGNAVPPVFAAHLAAHLLQQWAEGSELGMEQTPLVPYGNSFSSGIPHRKTRVAA